jgi:Arc/MetJ-type ribon-helix-helix transcriptional regulator
MECGGDMEVELTPDQEAFVRQAIRTGRIQRAEDAVTEALLLWEERELLRSEFLASLDDAKASIARGEGIPITQASMRSLADDVNRRGRERLASERQRRTDGT